MRAAHLWMGVLGLIAFVLSGQYMHHGFQHLYGMADGPRLLYRSAHIYLLWSALLNLMLGSLSQPTAAGRVRIVRRVCSFAVLSGPPLIVCGFLMEPGLSQLERPYTSIANYLALAGSLGLALLNVRAQSREPTQG